MKNEQSIEKRKNQAAQTQHPATFRVPMFVLVKNRFKRNVSSFFKHKFILNSYLQTYLILVLEKLVDGGQNNVVTLADSSCTLRPC